MAAKTNVKCTDCGTSIDASKDTAVGCTPCPNCGSVKRTVSAGLGPMQPSNYLLDNFVAHRLSLLSTCGAPEIPDESNWLNGFILTTVFKTSLDSKTRAYLFNFLRRAQGAYSAYRGARTALIEYIETPRNVLSPYFAALLNFEVCVSQCYQGYELLVMASGEKLFETNDGSEGERLQKLYVDSKHMDQMIDGGKLPTQATAAIWITNDGLESSRTKLSFEELVEMLLQMRRLAERLSIISPSAANSTPNPDAPRSGAPVS
jgi:hypothetical protein